MTSPTCWICGRVSDKATLVDPRSRRCVRSCFGRMKIGGRGGKHTAAEGRKRLRAMERSEFS